MERGSRGSPGPGSDSGAPGDADPDLAQDFSAALDRAIRDRQVTLRWIQQRLKSAGYQISVSTLSLWRSGRRHPEAAASIEALEVIEELLRLEPGALARRIGSHRRLGPHRRAPFDPRTGGACVSDDQDRQVHDLLERSGQLVIDVDERRRIVRASIRTLFQARIDHAVEVPVHVRVGGLPVETRPDIRGTAGCTVTPVAWDAGTGLLTATLTLDRPLRKGEVVMTEREVTGSDSYPGYGFVADRRQREAVLWVRFHPEAVPKSCTLTVATADGVEKTALPLVGPAVSHTATNFGPGSMLIEWSWPEGTSGAP